ncbi:beta-ketoacyl synthase N-terminal-like domain-containing protein, partial [Streptomyces sp. JAC128]
GLSVTLEAAGATSPDGRSKPFDASADGYGRGEGGAVLVLKRLSDAERDGDRVLAVIRGSGVQQDGRTNGIMAPSGTAQQQLLEET